jgi:hypothetical protein
MPFAVVNMVEIDDVETAAKALNAQVVPGVKQSPGFIHGTWLANAEQGNGMSAVVFDTREHAEAALQRIKSADFQVPPGVTFKHQAIFEVMAEA